MPKYLVSLREPIRDAEGVSIDNKLRKFGKSGHSFILNDAGEARELNAALGKKGAGKVIVSEMPEVRGVKTVKYITPRLSPQERREAMIRDGWREVRTGVWRKGLGE